MKALIRLMTNNTIPTKKANTEKGNIIENYIRIFKPFTYVRVFQEQMYDWKI